MTPAVEAWIASDSPYRPGGWRLAMIGPRTHTETDPYAPSAEAIAQYRRRHRCSRLEAQRRLRQRVFTAAVRVGRRLAERQDASESYYAALAALASYAPR
jgi:hypothetical protein